MLAFLNILKSQKLLQFESVFCKNYLNVQVYPLQLFRVALMEQFVWLMDLWRVLEEWRSVSMECGEQCVTVTGITGKPKLCADNWGTMSTQVKVSYKQQ